MAETLTPEVMEDAVAVSVARAVAAANRRARELGIDVEQAVISIMQSDAVEGGVWQINYGPRDYIGRRGGDLMIEVDEAQIQIRRVLRGQ